MEDSDESSDEDDEDIGNAAAMPTPPTSVFPSNPAACMREVLGAAVSSVGKLAAAPRKTQEKLTGALHARRRERMLLSVEAGGLAPARDEAVRLLSSSDEGGAWLRAIPRPAASMSPPLITDNIYNYIYPIRDFRTSYI